MNQIHQLANAPITAFAFNATKDQVAICPNSNEVLIYQKSPDWKLIHTLKGHDKLVTSIDWAPKTNRLVTCSQDRNAYVWSYDKQQQWKPTLVLLRINRAATFVRWSPNEDKFAVASGARCISVCYFEEDRDWWVSKHLKKPLRSTVLCLDWHPNNVLLACGSSDMKTRVFSAYIKGVDEKPKSSAWGERLPFNTLCAEYSTGHGSWVHAVQFSPDGSQLAWVSHDSSISIADPENGSVDYVPTQFLPFLSLQWLSPESIIAAGHDCQPMLFARKGGKWEYSEKLDQQEKTKKAAGSAFDKFKQMDSRAQQENTGTELTTTHQNSITQVRKYGNEIVTCGVDGKVVVWVALAEQMGRMRV